MPKATKPSNKLRKGFLKHVLAQYAEDKPVFDKEERRKQIVKKVEQRKKLTQKPKRKKKHEFVTGMLSKLQHDVMNLIHKGKNENS